MTIKTTWLKFSLISVSILLFPLSLVYAGDLYHLKLQEKAREQGWLSESQLGQLCKSREPNNSELEEFKIMCDGVTICLDDIKQINGLNDCANIGEVNNNTASESINDKAIPEQLPDSSQKNSIFSRIIDFFKGLFGFFS
jgi:hypothetical protein